MFLTLAIAVTLLMLAYTLFVRPKDVPETVPPPPYQHLEGRKASIYENLRDLQFEYRVGKLSDADYERTKKELQAELAKVLAEIDSMKNAAPAPAANLAKAAKTAAPVEGSSVCPHCSAKFDKPLRFCGECGKPMGVTA
jgi:rRNA maturation endonuclease Nob1